MTDVVEAELCSDLYDILEASTHDELGPIVDGLMKSPISVLKIGRAFERHYPDHVRYTDQIGDEINRLSLIVLGRSDGKRPSYEDMVSGLCKQISITAASNDISRNEALLLNTFSKQHLSSVPSSDRQRLVDAACVAASSAAKGTFSSDAWPLLASVLLQVAYLRRKLVDEGRIPAKFGGGAPEAFGQVPALVDDASDSLVIQTEDGHPILSLATLPAAGGAGWRGPESSLKVLNVLAPMLKAAQPFFSAEQVPPCQRH